MHVNLRRADWEFVSPFRIAYRTRTHAQTVVVELQDGDYQGRGEALGISYHGETVDTLMEQLSAFAVELRNGISREALQNLLPPGGARNAIDCALWDLESKRAGRRAAELAGISTVRPLVTAFTLGVDAPAAMGRAAAAADQYRLLKLKLTGEEDVERVASVRAARPDVDIIVDANQSWDEQRLYQLTSQLARFNVKLIEQPLPPERDEALVGFVSPVPLCADESCHVTECLPRLVGRYQYVNIKLDKTGGLTEALRLARAARDQGLRLMVGCMAGSSLSMAPAFIIGQLCDVVDLDGPLLSKSDVPGGIRYEGSRMFAPEAALWG